MKTKTKTLASLEIAIVLCSMLLVATLPAITTASEDDFTLEIYGNANEDDTIDMRDTTYIKLVIFGKKPKSRLADANYDGKISMLDVGQTKLIILGKEKELTIIDDGGESVIVSKPIERFIFHGHNIFDYETLRAIDAADKIVGITDRFVNPKGYYYSERYFPDLIGLTSVGLMKSPDYEVILNLKPDVIILDRPKLAPDMKEKLPGISVINIDVTTMNYKENTRKLGYVFDKREEAEGYIHWLKGWENEIMERTEGLSEDEKPLVLYGGYYKIGREQFSIFGKEHFRSDLVRRAGGKNLGDEMPGSASVKVDSEWIIERNPEIILLWVTSTGALSGYETDDPSKVIAILEDFLNRPEFAEVNAVKNKKVYILSGSHVGIGAASGFVGILYYTKWIHPSLFKDVDVELMHQEFVTRFQHLDYDLDEHGVFAYPPIETNGDLAGIPDRYKGEL